jgi:hypothetical protein
MELEGSSPYSQEPATVPKDPSDSVASWNIS